MFTHSRYARLFVGRLINPNTMQWRERNFELDKDLAKGSAKDAYWYLVFGVFAATMKALLGEPTPWSTLSSLKIFGRCAGQL